MAAAVKNSLRDETHEPNAPSAVHQVYVPLHLKQEKKAYNEISIRQQWQQTHAVVLKRPILFLVG